MKIENVAIGRVASVAEAKKIIRLADVGELEADLKKTWPKKRPKGRPRTSCIARASATSCPIWAICPPLTPKACAGTQGG